MAHIKYWWKFTTYWVVEYYEGRSVASETLYNRLTGSVYAQRTWKPSGLINSIRIQNEEWINPGGPTEVQPDGRVYEYTFPYDPYMSELSSKFENISRIYPIIY